MPKNAATYTRISSDDGKAKGVDRQRNDCMALAAKKKWTVVRDFTDNDVSAYGSKPRPAYVELMSAIRAGEIDAVVVWDTDRLTRTPTELEDFISIAAAHNVALASVGGEVDLDTEQGRLTARLKGSVARYEVEQSSRRLKAKFLERAQAGLPHGKAAYGFRREHVYDDQGRRVAANDVIDEEQADVIREASRRLLAGDSLRSVVRSLNEREAPSPRGKAWDPAILRQVMLRERNAGRRIHQGKVIGRGDWDTILDEGDFDRLVALLRDPNRRTQRGSDLKYLLSGLALCGRCGGRMRVSRRHNNNGKQQPAAYICPDCYKLRRKMSAVDEVVEAVVVGRLSLPDGPDLLAGDPAALKDAKKAVAEIESKMSNAADQYADDVITMEQLGRITGNLRPKLDKAKRRMNAAQPSPQLREFCGSDVAERWAAASLDAKRTVIDLLMTITILPSGAGRSFEPEQVQIEWKT